MTTYREIHGRSIKAVSTDPTGDITEGEIWYNTTSDTFKSVILNEAWVTAANGSNARGSLPGGGGTQTAAFAAGGYDGSDAVVDTEEYNGTGFSNGGNLSNKRYGLGGAGTLTAGVVFGGHENPPDNSNKTEEYSFEKNI